jgi:cytochrome c oxidase subunit 4
MAAETTTRTIVLVYLLLMGLLALTIGATFLPLGPFKPVANLGIAILKTGLIVWVFMHLREVAPMVRLFAAAALFWLALLIGLGLTDWLTRETLPGPRPQAVDAGPAPGDRAPP